MGGQPSGETGLLYCRLAHAIGVHHDGDGEGLVVVGPGAAEKSVNRQERDTVQTAGPAVEAALEHNPLAVCLDAEAEELADLSCAESEGQVLLSSWREVGGSLAGAGLGWAGLGWAGLAKDAIARVGSGGAQRGKPAAGQGQED
jgi:hypothetical protein